MKMFKLSSIALVSLLAASTTFAQNALTTDPAVGGAVIHYLIVQHPSNESVDAKVTMNMGNMQGGACVYSLPVDAGTFTFPAHSGTTLSLNGQILAQIVGVGYSCMQISMQAGNQTVNDNFMIGNNGAVYTYSDPSQFNVTVY